MFVGLICAVGVEHISIDIPYLDLTGYRARHAWDFLAGLYKTVGQEISFQRAYGTLIPAVDGRSPVFGAFFPTVTIKRERQVSGP